MGIWYQRESVAPLTLLLSHLYIYDLLFLWMGPGAEAAVHLWEIDTGPVRSNLSPEAEFLTEQYIFFAIEPIANLPNIIQSFFLRRSTHKSI